MSDDAYKVDSLLLESLGHEIEFVQIDLAAFSLELFVLSTSRRAEVVRHLPAEELAEVHEAACLLLLQDSLAFLEDLLGSRELDQVLSGNELTLTLLGVRVEQVLFVVSLAELETLNCEGVVLLLSQDCALGG